MKNHFKQKLRDFGVGIISRFGTKIRDCRTGESLGRGFVFAWGGQIHVVGLNMAVAPVPIPQTRITYWKQEIGFTRHEVPDLPRREPAISLLARGSGIPDKVLLVVMDHRAPEAVEATVGSWVAHGFAEDEILLVFGGPASHFAGIRHTPKAFLHGTRHKTTDHQRENQSYREIFDLVADYLEEHPSFTHVLFVEYDHVPLMPKINTKYLDHMQALDADVLCYDLRRIDGTMHPHFLALDSEPTKNSPPVFSILGTGHFWKREAWLASAKEKSLADWYLELDIPTTAIRLGFRVCGMADQEKFVSNLPENLPFTLAEAEALGAWTLHPVKSPHPTK